MERSAVTAIGRSPETQRKIVAANKTSAWYPAGVKPAGGARLNRMAQITRKLRIIWYRTLRSSIINHRGRLSIFSGLSNISSAIGSSNIQLSQTSGSLQPCRIERSFHLPDFQAAAQIGCCQQMAIMNLVYQATD